MNLSSALPYDSSGVKYTRLRWLTDSGLMPSLLAVAGLVAMGEVLAAPPLKRASENIASAGVAASTLRAPTAIPRAVGDAPVVVDESGNPPIGGQGTDNTGTCVIADDCKGGDAPGAPNPGNPTVTYGTGDNLTGNATQPALTVLANGSEGGRGGNAGESVDLSYQNGGAGAPGTQAGIITVTLGTGSSASSNNATGATVLVVGNGGVGGSGGASGGYGHYGTMANGGSGAGVNQGANAAPGLTLTANGSIVNSAPYQGDVLAPPAVLLESIGGDGGFDPGGSAKTSLDSLVGPTGSAGGHGGFIEYAVASNPTAPTPTITSNGPGLVAVSAGGDGGGGMDANTTSLEHATGGAGGAGGDGGTIQINSLNTTIIGRGVTAAGSAEPVQVDPNQPDVQAAVSFVSGGIIAQSFAGAGGAGGAGNGTFGPTTGGAGGAAGDGGDINVHSAGVITMTGYGAAAIAAQSVGGSGGNGAMAGTIFMGKAGNGGPGGDGGNVLVEADDLLDTSKGHALVTTHGDDADGLLAQSIGGGGGNGGSVSFTTGLVVPFALALGGNGETGGNGGFASAYVGNDNPDSNVVTPGAIIGTQGTAFGGCGGAKHRRRRRQWRLGQRHDSGRRSLRCRGRRGRQRRYRRRARRGTGVHPELRGRADRRPAFERPECAGHRRRRRQRRSCRRADRGRAAHRGDRGRRQWRQRRCVR